MAGRSGLLTTHNNLQTRAMPLSFYLSRAYLLDLQPNPLGPRGRILLPALVIAALLVGGWLRAPASRTGDPIKGAALQKLSQPLLIMGGIGAAYALVAWLAVPLLAMRLWLLLLAAAAIGWIAAVGYREWRSLPARRAERERRLQLEKYLPR